MPYFIGNSVFTESSPCKRKFASSNLERISLRYDRAAIYDLDLNSFILPVVTWVAWKLLAVQFLPSNDIKCRVKRIPSLSNALNRQQVSPFVNSADIIAAAKGINKVVIFGSFVHRPSAHMISVHPDACRTGLE